MVKGGGDTGKDVIFANLEEPVPRAIHITDITSRHKAEGPRKTHVEPPVGKCAGSGFSGKWECSDFSAKRDGNRTDKTRNSRGLSS